MKFIMILILSLIGSYIDGERYKSPRLVELVKERFEWFPDYVKDMAIQTYGIIKNTPILKDVSEMEKLDVVEIGRELIHNWEKHFPRMMSGVKGEEEFKGKNITSFEFSKEIE